MDWALLLVLLGIILLGLEFMNPGIFFMTPGIICCATGLMMLAFPDNDMVFLVGLPIMVALATGATLYFYKRLGAMMEGGETTTSGSDMVGKHGIMLVATELGTNKGKVRIDGQDWSAKSIDVIPEDTKVIVTAFSGVTVTVEVAE